MYRGSCNGHVVVAVVVYGNIDKNGNSYLYVIFYIELYCIRCNAMLC